MSAMQRYDGVRVESIPDPRPGMRRIAAKGAGKSGGTSGSQTSPHQPHEYPNTLRSRSMVRIIEAVSEGPVYGPVGNISVWQAVFVDQTPIMDAAGNVQFAFRGDFRYGNPSQDPIPGFPIAEAAFNVGVQTQYAVPIVRSCNTPPLDAIRYILRVPALYHNESSGDVVGASVGYAFDIQVNGGLWTNVVTERISGKTMSPYERAVRVTLPTPSPTSLNIRVIRLDPDPETDTAADLFWSGYIEIIDGAISYDDTSVWALELDAETFPSVPQRGYLMDGVMVDLPTNYNGRNHGYSGPWNGTFYTQWTNNPAWLLYALLVNERWGVGRQIDIAAIDKWSFYEAAVSNDGSVPDGKGGMEVRWTCNCVLNTRQDAYSVLNALASSMLGSLYYSNGTVFLVQDRRVPTPTRSFTDADVEDGIFDYVGSDVRSRWSAVAVTWNDPEDNFDPAIELVVDPVLVSQQGYREHEQVAFGCTSRGQAQRVGRWLIYTSQFETETVTFRVSIENADLRPGDVVNISDPSRAGARLGGRLLHNDAVNMVTLDRLPDEMRANPRAWILVITVGSAAEPGNAPRVHQLAVGNIDADDNVWVGKPEPLPEGSTWIARAGAVEPTQWRINAVADRGQGVYEVLATEYHEEKFDYVDNGTLIPPPSFTLLPTGPLLAPTDVKHREYIYLDSAGFPQFAVILSWTPAKDPRVQRYQLELSGPGADYRRVDQLGVMSWEFPAMREGEWTAVLIGFDNLGRRTPSVRYVFTPVGRTVKPAAPLSLYLTPQDRQTTLVWVPTGEIDVVSYWIKWSPRTDGTATWERATTSVARVSRSITQFTTPTRFGTLMIKSVDSLGQESDDYASAILTEQIVDDIYQTTIIEQPDWGGVRGAHWHQNLTELWLPPPSEPEVIPPGIFPGDRNLALNDVPTRLDTYTFQDELNLGIVSAVSMTAITEGYGIFMGVVMAKWVPLGSADPLASGRQGSMSSWVPLAIAVPLAMGTSQNFDAHIEVRTSQDGVNFAGWTPLKSAVITGQRFQWRMIGTLYDLLTTLRMDRCEVRIEIPLRSVQGDDVPLSAVNGHLSIAYAVPFLDTPTVQITARQGLAPGGNILLTVSDRDHFEVQHVTSTNANAPGGSIDYFVQGFGGHA